MVEAKVAEMARRWDVDEDALLAAFHGCQALIARALPNHARCSQMHVATMLAADYLTTIVEAGYLTDAYSLYVNMGAEVPALTWGTPLS